MFCLFAKLTPYNKVQGMLPEVQVIGFVSG